MPYTTLVCRTIFHEEPKDSGTHASMVAVVSAHLPAGHSRCNGPVQLSATEAALSQDRACETVYRLLATDDQPWTI